MVEGFICVSYVITNPYLEVKGIEEKGIPIDKIDTIVPTCMKIDYDKLPEETRNNYKKETVENRTVSRIFLKEPDKCLNTEEIWVLGAPKEICEELNQISALVYGGLNAKD